ncbi:MAG: AraC family transcriptional regulator [Clostridia bacterium]|nr:AraC family transcriptional regulator [Clostridia bacterium]
MFYESKNSLRTDLLKTETGIDFHFPPHLHGSYELILVTEGEMTVTVGETEYTLTQGRAILIFPNQIHSLRTPRHSRHLLCIFSEKLVQSFSKSVSEKIPTDNLFSPSPFYLDRLYSLYSAPASFNESDIKGLLYSLCGEFDRGAVYEERPHNREDLLARIFAFVETHYASDCSLEALSAHISYHYVYLSRFFKEQTGISFTDYVNRYRINEAGYLLKNTDRSILQTAYDCGFDSLRSFNRNFKKIIGIPPVQYRKKR